MISASIIIGGTILAIQYAKGGRPSTQGIRDTGLLVVNSFPTGAQVYINDKLTTATDNTLNLEPGEYLIEIKKDGYSTWRKNLKIESELVAQTNAVLFPIVPSLAPLTFTGVQKVLPAPDGQKLLYYTASASATNRNGVYLLDLNDTPLSLQRAARQILTDGPRIDLAQAEYIWSPDSTEVLVTDGNQALLIDITKNNDLEDIQDVSLQLSRILSTWEEEMYLRERQFLARFPDEIIALATQSAVNVYFSPDQERLLYTATASVSLPENLIPQLPAANSQPQERNLTPGGMYVFDRKEDRNFRIGTLENLQLEQAKRLLATDLSNREPLSLESSPSAFRRLQATDSAQTATNFRRYHSGLYTGPLQWYPNSKHLIKVEPTRTSLIEYDNTNDMTVYAGPFDPSFVYPWSNGEKLIVLTSFNQSPDEARNLYGIELR